MVHVTESDSIAIHRGENVEQNRHHNRRALRLDAITNLSAFASHALTSAVMQVSNNVHTATRQYGAQNLQSVSVNES